GTPIFMDGAVSTIFADFQSRYADVNIEQFYGYQDTLIADLRNDALDMAVLPLHPSQVPADLEFTPLLSGLNVITCR
ncbi:hypothetical protein Q6325_30635, partial [Klebsiella pneumoniae]